MGRLNEASLWPRRLGWTLSWFSAALNVLNAPGVAASVRLVHNLIGVLWLFSTHLFLGLALCCVLIPRARRRPLTQRRAMWWLVLALISLLAFPVSEIDEQRRR